MPSYAISSNCIAKEEGKDNSLSLQAHSTLGSSISPSTSASPLLQNRPSCSDILELGRNGTMGRLIRELEQGVGYDGATCGDELEDLVREMRTQADATGIAYPKDSGAHHAFQFGVTISHLCYPRLPLEERVYAGTYTWLTLLIDDGAGKDHEQWLEFTPRFLMGGRQLCAASRAFAQHLQLAYKYFSTAVANFIITSSLNFVNATALEGSELRRLTRTTGGESWPYYLRDKDGVAEAFTWLTFPKCVCPDLTMCIEAVADMSKYMCFTNDILSFYKEEQAGENNNYVHNRAFYSGQDVDTVLEEMVVEDIAVHGRIMAVLQGREPYARVWLDFAMGFITLHKVNKRYKLQELGLGESDPLETVFGNTTS